MKSSGLFKGTNSPADDTLGRSQTLCSTSSSGGAPVLRALAGIWPDASSNEGTKVALSVDRQPDTIDAVGIGPLSHIPSPLLVRFELRARRERLTTILPFAATTNRNLGSGSGRMASVRRTSALLPPRASTTWSSAHLPPAHARAATCAGSRVVSAGNRRRCLALQRSKFPGKRVSGRTSRRKTIFPPWRSRSGGRPGTRDSDLTAADAFGATTAPTRPSTTDEVPPMAASTENRFGREGLRDAARLDCARHEAAADAGDGALNEQAGSSGGCHEGTATAPPAVAPPESFPGEVAASTVT